MLKKGKVIDLDNKLAGKKIACLTLDVEQDHANLLREHSYEGLTHIPTLVEFLKHRGVPLTCFVQASLFETHFSYLEAFSPLNVEFEVHSYSHPSLEKLNTQFEIRKAREIYREYFGRDPLGYRSPLGFLKKRKAFETLSSNGFLFDSSIFPTYRPGMFNNLAFPTRPFYPTDSELIEFPISVLSDLLRIPFGLSYMQLLGRFYLYLLKAVNLPNLIIFDFHLHNLFPLHASQKIPLDQVSFPYKIIFKRAYQDTVNGLAVLERLISVLQEKGFMFLKLKKVYNMFS